MPLPDFTFTGPGLTVVATPVPQRAAIPLTGNPSQVLVTNFGPGVAFIAIGDGTVTADTGTSVPVLPGKQMVFDRGPAEATTVGYISGQDHNAGLRINPGA